MFHFDVVVIGSGPGGYVAAIRGAQLGLNVAVIEKDTSGLGGTCLRRGCVPAKTWLESAHRFEHFSNIKDFGIDGVDDAKISVNLDTIVRRKNRIILKNSKGIDFLMKKNKVTVINGKAELLNGNRILVNKQDIYTASKIILATGSVPKAIQSFCVDGVKILDSNDILDLREIPNHLVILGAGAIGVEFASIFARLGAKVTLVEAMNRILPLEDESISFELSKIFVKKYKIDVMVNTKINSISDVDGHVLCSLVGHSSSNIKCSHLLVAIGRSPVTSNLGFESVNIEMKNSFIVVDEFMRSSQADIYAIGDVVNTPMLAHVASDEGILAIEHAARELGVNVTPHIINYDLVPSCTYCDPEIGSVGLSESQARQRYNNIKVGMFSFLPLAKANIIGESYGFIKIISNCDNDRILGIHIIGPKATELISASLAMLNNNCTVSKLIQTMHPHPTLNEAFVEAARNVYSMAIHA